MIPRTIFEEEHNIFRDSVAKFIAAELTPYHDQWEEDGFVPKEAWIKMGEAGLLGCTMPEEYGGSGAGFIYAAIVTEELGKAGISGPSFWLHSEVIAGYIARYGTPEQKQQWLPGMASGHIRGCLGLTEPGAGSDLAAITTTAVRDGDEFVINGSKVFITHGHTAEVCVLACKTDPTAGKKGVSQIIVPTDTPGFRRGKYLKKIGLKAQDTAELFFDNVRVPVTNLLGEENRGFYQMMADLGTERLLQAVRGLAASEAAIQWTIEYTKERKAFGKTIAAFQNTQFVIAELQAQTCAARALLDRCIQLMDRGELDSVDAARAKLVCVELQGKVMDACLQLHGGWGYIWEYPIARAFADGRISRLAGGTTEIMKQLIANELFDLRR